LPGADPKLQLYLAHRAALIDYAAPIVGCRVRAEDVVQEAWLRFSAAADKERTEANQIVQPLAYLYRIVRNLALDLVRKLNAESVHPAGSVLLHEVPAAVPGPEQEAVDRNQVRVLAAALQELPPRTRLAFDLHRFGGKTFAEIGAVLGISQARAHGLVQEAVAYCIARLSRSGPP
jgi:RNA polymerase sigma-70 factor (ECF subfamily)